MKYEVGEKVVLRKVFEPIDTVFKIIGFSPGCKYEVVKTSGGRHYYVINDDIDHEKTAELNENVRSNEAFENFYQDMPPLDVRELLSTPVSRRKNGNVATETNAVMQRLLSEPDAIEPEHYRKGEVDLYESWYRTRPFNEYRAIMESIAERYIKRDKENRVEDLDKAIYTLERLKEKEEERARG